MIQYNLEPGDRLIGCLHVLQAPLKLLGVSASEAVAAINGHDLVLVSATCGSSARALPSFDDSRFRGAPLLEKPQKFARLSLARNQTKLNRRHHHQHYFPACSCNDMIGGRPGGRRGEEWGLQTSLEDNSRAARTDAKQSQIGSHVENGR